MNFHGLLTMIKPVDFSTEFLRGQNDCAEGKPHSSGQSEAYDRGYATQYEREQILSEKTK